MKMKYNVNWLISGTIDTDAASKEEAENLRKVKIHDNKTS